MKIKNIKIEKLYGSLDKDIDFNEDLSILVGINGSGKTSILNVINWIITPSLADLCVTEFKRIVLTLHYNNIEYTIECTQSGKDLKYIVSENEKIYEPLSIKILRDPASIENNYELRATLIEEYKALKPTEEETDTWNLIKSFTNPTFIGINRSIITENSDDLFYYQENISNIYRRKRQNKRTPLEYIKNIVNTEFRKSKSEILKKTNTLKNYLMLTTFDGSITQEDILRDPNPDNIDTDKIDKLEKSIFDFLKKFAEVSIDIDQDKKSNNIFLH